MTAYKTLTRQSNTITFSCISSHTQWEARLDLFEPCPQLCNKVSQQTRTPPISSGQRFFAILRRNQATCALE